MVINSVSNPYLNPVRYPGFLMNADLDPDFGVKKLRKKLCGKEIKI
jgi:hypothetical protein